MLYLSAQFGQDEIDIYEYSYDPENIASYEELTLDLQDMHYITRTPQTLDRLYDEIAGSAWQRLGDELSMALPQVLAITKSHIPVEHLDEYVLTYEHTVASRDEAFVLEQPSRGILSDRKQQRPYVLSTQEGSFLYVDTGIQRYMVVSEGVFFVQSWPRVFTTDKRHLRGLKSGLEKIIRELNPGNYTVHQINDDKPVNWVRGNL